MTKAKNYQEIAEEGYQGMTDSEVHLMAKEIGVRIHPQAKGDLVKQRINEHLGIGSSTESKPKESSGNVTAIGSRMTRLDPMPSLNGDGRWGGRMHIVRINRQSDDPPAMTHYLITWEGMTVKIPLDQPYQIPAPHYYRLRDNYAEHTRNIEKTNDDGEKYIDRVTTKSRVRNFEDLGVVPETGHLPDGKKDFLQEQARKKNCFAQFERRELIKVHGILRNTTSVQLRDVSDADILAEILETLGPEFSEAHDQDEVAA